MHSYNRFTPLHLANDPEIVKLLVENKAELNAKDSSNRTALLLSARSKSHADLGSRAQVGFLDKGIQ